MELKTKFHLKKGYSIQSHSINTNTYETQYVEYNNKRSEHEKQNEKFSITYNLTDHTYSRKKKKYRCN